MNYVELISMISVGRLFHSLMVLGKNLRWYAVVEILVYKVIQMVLSSWILCCYAASYVHRLYIPYPGLHTENSSKKFYDPTALYLSTPFFDLSVYVYNF